MQKQGGKGREKYNEWFRTPRRSASSNGEARCSSAPTLQASLEEPITDVTSRNRHVSAKVLLQGGGSEGTVTRESVITNMEVPDADAVKVAKSAFFLGKEVLPNDDWTVKPRSYRGRRAPGAEDEQEDLVQGLRDDVTAVAKSVRGNGAGVQHGSGASALLLPSPSPSSPSNLVALPPHHLAFSLPLSLLLLVGRVLGCVVFFWLFFVFVLVFFV